MARNKLLRAMEEIELEQGKLAAAAIRRYKTTLRYNGPERTLVRAAAAREKIEVAVFIRRASLGIARAIMERP